MLKCIGGLLGRAVLANADVALRAGFLQAAIEKMGTFGWDDFEGADAVSNVTKFNALLKELNTATAAADMVDVIHADSKRKLGEIDLRTSFGRTRRTHKAARTARAPLFV